MCPPLLGSAPLLCEVRLGAMGIAVDAVVLQRVGGIEHPLDRLGPVSFLAFLDVIASKTQVIEDAVGVGPLSKQVIVLKKMIMAESGMRYYQRLHRHGIFFHDVADARIGVDDNLVREPLQPLAIKGCEIGKTLAETPMALQQSQDDRGVSIEHLLGGDHLDLNGIDVEAELVE